MAKHLVTSWKKVFHQLLGNVLVASVTNFFVWFALTYWIFLNTKSIIATSALAGTFALLNTISAFIFWGIVDHNKKRNVMIASSCISLIMFTVGTLIYFLSPAEAFSTASSPMLWVLVVTLMLWVLAGNLRAITMQTSVTLLLPESEHASANGKIGTVNGISFSLISVASWLMIWFAGIWPSLLAAVISSLLVVAHLLTLQLPNDVVEHHADKPKKLDIKGTIKIINTIPGMFALIFFTTFNNFLGWVFMALMDAYGLSLVSVQAWWIMWWVLSFGFILWGILIAKFGLGKNPLSTMFRINLITWSVCILFVIQPWIWLMALGIFVWLVCTPFIEASESTVIQKVVPFERQGRVFGFAQSVEFAATPITAFLIGPLTQLVFIPFMTTGAWVQLIGNWFGTGAARGIALVFITAGFVGLCMTVLARSSKYYRMLSNKYKQAHQEVAPSIETTSEVISS